jgi:ATP/maltotriose-dependent transcriptional regulator MalT
VELVCAPAGSGKTALLRSWATVVGEPVACVTVDRGERDAQRFWLHVISALADAAGGDVVERVSPAPSFAGAAVVERLVDQLEQLEEPLVLVVDDLHDSNQTTRWPGSSCCCASSRRRSGSSWPRARTPGSDCTGCGSRVR